MKIADVNGSWFLNSGSYGFVDPESGTRFDPGEPTKATKTAWLELQAGFIKPCDDPTKPVEVKEPAKEPSKEPSKQA